MTNTKRSYAFNGRMSSIKI